MKIVQINSCVNILSTGKIAEQIGEKIIQNGWESYIAYARSFRPSRSILIKIGTKFDIIIHLILARFFDLAGFGSKRSTRKLINRLKKIQPDIVHMHIMHGYYINIELLFEYLKNENIPTIWTLHDCWAFTGHCALLGCNKWKTFCYNCPKIHSYPNSYFIDRSKENFFKKFKIFTSIDNLTLVAISDWMFDNIKQSFLSKKTCFKINNGIDTNIFVQRKLKYDLKSRYNIKDEIVLISLATTWNREKGLFDYLNLSKKLPSNFKLILVGVNNQLLNNLPHNIIGINRIDNIDELVDLYNLATIVLNLSHYESFGLTTIEGFACGTPAIAYNVTASTELITKETGIIIKFGDIDGVVSAINNIAIKGKLYYSKACIERAKTKFDCKTNYEKYIELYKNIITNYCHDQNFS